MDWESVWPIMKWVVLVFLAGFIGYFGRHLSQTLIARMRKRKKEEIATSTSAAPSTPQDRELQVQKQKAKLEKKRLKSQIKRNKKK